MSMMRSNGRARSCRPGKASKHAKSAVSPFLLHAERLYLGFADASHARKSWMKRGDSPIPSIGAEVKTASYANARNRERTDRHAIPGAGVSIRA